MKVTAVESILLTIPFRSSAGTTSLAGRASEGLNMLLVRVETDGGLTGWGEAFGHGGCAATKTALDTLVAPLLVGRDPSDIDRLMTDMKRSLHLFGRSGPVMYALSGVDIALWDIAGKVAGAPLSRLLGGDPRPRAAYASLLRCSGPDAVARSCELALEQGYRQIKLHEISYPAVEAARAAIGPAVPLMLDANCPWILDEAIAMAHRLRGLDLAWLEEPLWPPEDYAGLAEVRRAGAIVAAGENAAGFLDFQRAFDLQALDVAQPSVTKVGGISEVRRIVALADQRRVRVEMHIPYFGPGFVASLHLISTLAPDAMVERLAVDLEASPLGDVVDVRSDGTMRIPDGPGLGVDPEPALIDKYRTHPRHVIT